MTEQNQTPRQDDDAEGHVRHGFDTKDDDTEGHARRRADKADTTRDDDTKGDDVEGHHIR
jgi:hypothetical protein